MSVIPIPNGTATIRDELVSERHFRILEAGYVSAQPVINKLQYAVTVFTMNKLGFEEGATLTQKQIDKLKKAMESLTEDERAIALAPITFTPSETMTMFEIQDAVIVAFLEHWSRKDPLPTLDTIQNIDRATWKVLADATQDRGTVALLSIVNFEPPTKEQEAENGLDFSPTGNSSDLSSISPVSPKTP